MRWGWPGLVGVLSLALLLSGPAMAVEEPAGYRMGAYRSPVPASLSGATVVDTQTAAGLREQGGVSFIDVLPRPPKPENLPEGTVWRDKPRNSIAGAVWLPNVGFGQLPAEGEHYFRQGLSEVTAGDLDHPLIFFCLADCWMSWNAAKRALGYGYRKVYWFPEGTDGWAEAERPMEVIEPLEVDSGAD